MIKKIIALCLVFLCMLFVFSCSESKGNLINTLSDREYTFEFYGSGDTVTSLVIKKSGKVNGTFKTYGSSPVLEDLNFDSYKDIKLVDERNEGHFVCYIYQSEVGVFSPNALLGSMTDPVWDTENRIIKSKTHSIEKTTSDESDAPAAYKETRGEAVWEWQGGVPVKLSETGLEYFSDSGLFCYYKCTLVAGECVRDNCADKWYYRDELEKAVLSWDD